MNPKLPRILALAPDGFEGMDVVAAACRASALGVLDLSSGWQGAVEVARFARLRRLTPGPFGLRIPLEGMDEGRGLRREMPGLEVVWIPAGETRPDRLKAVVEAARRVGRLVLGEVTT